MSFTRCVTAMVCALAVCAGNQYLCVISDRHISDERKEIRAAAHQDGWNDAIREVQRAYNDAARQNSQRSSIRPAPRSFNHVQQFNKA